MRKAGIITKYLELDSSAAAPEIKKALSSHSDEGFIRIEIQMIKMLTKNSKKPKRLMKY